MLKKIDKYIWFVLAIAIVLRFVGIDHGFPFIFHPDEPTIVRSALGVRFNINPGHFDWPHLMIYLNYFLFMVFAKLRDVVTALGYKEQIYFALPLIYNDELIFYLLSRSLSALLGALTVIPIYLTAKTMFGKKAGLLAAFAMAVTPFHVWHSHYSLGDVPMTFFLAFSLYFSSKILFRKEMKNYVWAGLFAGLAASAKYNGLLIVGAIVLAHFMRVFFEKDERIFDTDLVTHLISAAVMSVVGFLVGTPFAVLDYKTFIRTDGPKGALWQFTNVGKVSFVNHLRQFVEVMTIKLPENFGYVFIILFVMAFIYVIANAIINKQLWLNRDLLFFTLIGIGLIYYVSGLAKTRSHYFFIAYPAVICGSVGFLSHVLDSYKSRLKNLIWVPVLVVPLYLSTLNSLAFYKEDTRVELYNWALTNSYKDSVMFVTDRGVGEVLSNVGIEVEKVDNSPGSLPCGLYYVASEEDARSETLNQILFIDSKGRRGPDIWVYSPKL